MSLTAPILDDRKFQQIVDEVRKRIPLYCPEWTDNNVSDPGITLIELFSWMVEMLLYRLNRVPDLHYFKFMELLGQQRKAPSAAQTRVTFWLSKQLTETSDPDHLGLKIPVGVEVSTTQTELVQPIVFTTDEEFAIHAPIVKAIVIERLEEKQLNRQAMRLTELRNLRAGLNGMDMFSKIPYDNEAVYLGFDNFKRDLSYHILSLKLNFVNRAGVGVNRDFPPYVWEAYTPEGEWKAIDVEKDTTRALNVAGEVVLHLPQLGKRALVEPEEMHWVRVRIHHPTPEQEAQGMRRYNDTPYLEQIIEVACIGASVNAANARVATKELVGESDGSPGQRFQLDATPVLLPLRADEQLRVKVDEDQDGELWQYVAHFADSNEHTPHFTLDSLSGEVRLGPAVRQPNGEIKRYGRVPPRGARLIFECYRYTGGARGNVAKRLLNVLKTSIPYVDHVENRSAAEGGMDGQSVEAAQLEIQRLIRTRQLAVTPGDYEARVLEQFYGKIARVVCLPITTNPKASMRILLIPSLASMNVSSSMDYLTKAQLDVQESVRGAIDAYLRQISMITVQVSVENFAYRRARVVAKLRLKERVNQEAIERAARQRLTLLIHPVTGGGDGKGWPFKKILTAADVQHWLEELPGVQAVEDVELQEVEDVGPYKVAAKDQIVQKTVTEIKLEPGEMLVSGHHDVTFVR